RASLPRKPSRSFVSPAETVPSPVTAPHLSRQTPHLPSRKATARTPRLGAPASCRPRPLRPALSPFSSEKVASGHRPYWPDALERICHEPATAHRPPPYPVLRPPPLPAH